MSEENKEEPKVKSLKKALDILDCFLDKQPLGITEISKQMHLYPSNVHAILSTFVSTGFLEQNDESSKYSLSGKFLAYAKAFSSQFPIKNLAVPYLDRLSNICTQNVYLAVPMHHESLYLYEVIPANSKRYYCGLFQETSLRMHCDAAGKVFLAHMNKEQLNHYLSTGLEASTRNTITDPEALLQELSDIRKKGYALDIMENSYLSKAIAVPVYNKANRLEGAISICCSPSEISEEQLIQLYSSMQETARNIRQVL